MKVPLQEVVAAQDPLIKFRHLAYYAFVCIGLAIVYFGAAKLGLSLAFAEKNVSPVWPPTGIALAAVLLFGYRAWPGIALGAFVANYTTGLSLVSASGIAVGNTLEALTGAFLLRRFVGLQSLFDRAGDVFKFVGLACLLSTMVSATIGTTSLYLGGFTGGISYRYLWWTWWLGDAMGDLVVATVILTWSARLRPRWRSSQATEAALLLILITIVGGIVLGPWFPARFERVYLTVPLILLATFRFKHRGATTAIFLLSAIAIWWTRYGDGPFVSANLNESLLSLQMFMGVTAVMALGLAAVINERSETEAVHRESEQRYRAIVEGAVEGIFLVDVDSKRLLEANTVYRNLLGYTADEILQLTLYDVVAHDRESINRNIREILARNHYVIGERRHRRKDGSLVDVEGGVNLISYDGREVMCVIARDITERKQAQEALRESEEKYRLLIQNSPYCIHQINLEGQLSSMNKAGLQMMGLKDESEIVNVPYLQAVAEKDQDRIGRLLQAALKGESSEFEFTATNGRIFHSSFVPIRDNNGRVIRLMGLTQDITKRKQAEDQLQQAKAKYQSIFDSSIEGIFQTTPEGRFLTANPALARTLGFASPEELIHERTDIARQSYVRPERREEFKRLMADQGTVSGFECEVYRKDGSMIWISETARTIRDADGRIVCYEGTIEDITDRKRAEEELRRGAAEFQRVITSLSDYLWSAEFDSQGNWTYSYYSPVVEKITGRPPEFYMPSPERWLSTIHPEDRPRLLQAFERITKGHSAHEEEEYRIMLPDGMVRWLRDSATVTPLEQGHFRVDGVVSDITQRKRADAVQSALYRIAEKTSSVQDMQEFYSAIHEIVGGLMYAKNFYIALYDPSTEIVSFPYFVDEIDLSAPPYKAGKGLTAYVIRTGEPLLASPEKFKQLVEEGLVEPMGAPSIDWLGVPLKIGGETFGVLAVQSYTEKVRFGEKEKDLLTFVSQHIATALDRKRSEQALKESEEKYRLFFEEDLTGDYISTPDGRILACNPAFARIFGFTSAEEALSCTVTSLYPDVEARTSFLELLRNQKKLEYYESELRRRDGESVYLIENAIGIFNEKGELIQVKGYVFDNTQQKKLEEQLRQAQKLKAIGQLAGGVAHDFNNILMAITAYCELLEMKLGSTHPLQPDVLEIQKAAQQGASLTRQLLAFSRKQVLELKVLDLNHVLANTQSMLRRLIRENIELSMVFGSDLGCVRADLGQLEQMIINLAVNAQDAMPQGGKLAIETTNVELDDDFVRLHVGAVAGRHVMLVVRDTGVGMDKTTLSRIFEPFFTTKEKGKGTGLGLSGVYGSVKQSGGYISVESEPGRGTSFRIYLPRVDEPEEVLRSREPISNSFSGSKTILLVDDNESVRNSIEALLEMQDYTVLKAADGQEALEISQKCEVPIELLITDMVMPVMSGTELAQRLLSQRPKMKVLFMSGYSEEAVSGKEISGSSTAFLTKPVSMEKMVNKIRDLLNS